MGQSMIEAIDRTYRNFRDAQVLDVSVGPRREVTLVISPLEWRGSRGDLADTVAVRFGAIEDFERVAGNFREIPSLQSEIGFLGVDHGVDCENGDCHGFRFEAERRDFEFRFCCSTVSIESVGDRR